MNELIKYDVIKDAVEFSFNEYINEESYNSAQAAARILEEDWREVNYNIFTKSSYFLSIAIESFVRNEIADFIYDKLDKIVIENVDELQNISEEEKDLYQQDLQYYKKLRAQNNYKIIETTVEGKMRIDYILTL